MGFFDFLKRKRNSGLESSKSEKSSKDFSFSEIKNSIEEIIEKRRKEENKELEFLEDMKKNFLKEIKEKIEVLKKSKPDFTRADEKIKDIVEENKERYISHLENALEKLEEIKTEGLDEFRKKINEIFLKLHEKSYKNYRRTTVLIRKEIFAVNKSIQDFSKNLLRKFNEELVKEIDELEEIKKKIKETENIDEKIINTSENLGSLEKDLLKKEEEKRKLLEEVENIQKSEEYKENLRKEKELKELKEKLNNLIIDLRTKIDFKKMANFFHIFPEKIKIVKNLKENFVRKFKLNREEILNLLKESNLKTSELENKLNQIKEIEEKIKEISKEIIEDKISSKKRDIEKTNFEIELIKEKISEKEKLKKNLEENKEKSIENIKSDFKEKN